MTIKEALEVLQKEYNCKTDKEYVCGSFDTCDKCGYYTSGESFTEALKTVLDAFSNGSEIPNSSDCISRSTDEAAFWEKRAKEYSDMINDLVLKMAKGVKFDTIVMNEEGFTLKQAEQKWIPCKKKLPEESNTYIATLIDDGRYFTDVVEWNSTFGGRWQSVFYDDSPIGEYHDISNVIAWQPLPEPYRGDTK